METVKPQNDFELRFFGHIGGCWKSFLQKILLEQKQEKQSKMTLERHKSKLIPDVDFSLEGRVFVTDTEGTFPIRGGGKSREKLPGPDAFARPSMVGSDDVPVRDNQSFHSYDPKRMSEYERKRKYKPKEPSRFGQEVANLPNSKYFRSKHIERIVWFQSEFPVLWG